MSPTERRRADIAQQRATQARRDASALRCVRLGAGKTLREVHEALVLGCTLTAGTPIVVTRRTLAGLVERGQVIERAGVFYPVSAEGGRREPAPAPVAAPETGEAAQTAGAGAAGPSESVLRTPASAGPAGTAEEPPAGVRPTSPAAPTAGDTPPSSGEQAQNRHRHPDPAPSDDPRLTALDQDGHAEDGRNAGDRVEAAGAVLISGDGGETGLPRVESAPPSDAARASEARITDAAPAGETEGVVVPSEPAPTSPPEPTVSAYRHRVDAAAVESYVLAHPGCGFREIARALECSDTHVNNVVRGRKGYQRPHLREERPRPGRTAPVRLYPLSPPSPTSPPGEAATASGGDLEAADDPLPGWPTLAPSSGIDTEEALATLRGELDAAHARADKHYARVRELEEQVQRLRDLAAERAQSREAYAVEVSTLTVLVERALSAAGLPAEGDDPLLFRLGVLVERLRAQAGAP